MHCLTSTIKMPQMLYQFKKKTRIASLVLSLGRPNMLLWATELATLKCTTL